MANIDLSINWELDRGGSFIDSFNDRQIYNYFNFSEANFKKSLYYRAQQYISSVLLQIYELAPYDTGYLSRNLALNTMKIDGNNTLEIVFDAAYYWVYLSTGANNTIPNPFAIYPLTNMHLKLTRDIATLAGRFMLEPSLKYPESINKTMKGFKGVSDLVLIDEFNVIESSDARFRAAPMYPLRPVPKNKKFVMKRKYSRRKR